MPTAPEAPSAPTANDNDSSPLQDNGISPTNNPLLDRLEQQQRDRLATGRGRGRGRSSSWRPTTARGSSATSRVASPASARSVHSVHETTFMLNEDQANYIQDLADNPGDRSAGRLMREAITPSTGPTISRGRFSWTKSGFSDSVNHPESEYVLCFVVGRDTKIVGVSDLVST